MPNGGSDCCGTCIFNEVNNGQAGFPKGNIQEVFTSSYCKIRQLKIDKTSPMYTYCSNHPHHNPSLIDIPIGPVFIYETREIWKPCRDNPEIRSMILTLLKNLKEKTKSQYPHGIPINEIAIFHAGQIEMEDAAPELERIIQFDISKTNVNDPFRKTRSYAVYHALQALAKIKGEQAIDIIDQFLERKGKENETDNKYLMKILKFALAALDIIDSQKARERIVELEKHLDVDDEEKSEFS